MLWSARSDPSLWRIGSWSVDGGREEFEVGREVPFLSTEPTGGDASGVKLVCTCGRVADFKEAPSPVLPSREWVAAGVRGGDCTAETGGEACGEAKPLVPSPLRLDS